MGMAESTLTISSFNCIEISVHTKVPPILLSAITVPAAGGISIGVSFINYYILFRRNERYTQKKVKEAKMGRSGSCFLSVFVVAERVSIEVSRCVCGVCVCARVTHWNRISF